MPAKKHSFHLDPEEKEIPAAFEQGELKSTSNRIDEMQLAAQAATAYFKKDARVNIRIPSQDLRRIKEIAAYEGLPYQTFIASLLHKLAAGHLVYR